MLKFIKGEKTIYEVQLDEIEPLSYVTYEEIVSLQSENDVIFAMLFCQGEKSVYLAENIAALRYGKTGEQLVIFDIKDPVSRIKCDEVWLFILTKSKVLDDNYQAIFLCEEKDIGIYPLHLHFITRKLFYDDDSLTPLVFCMYFLGYMLLFGGMAVLYVIVIRWLFATK